jgi:hypothetical protein
MTSTTSPSLGGLPLPFELPAALAAGPGGPGGAPRTGAAGRTSAATTGKARTTTAAARSPAKKTSRAATPGTASARTSAAKAPGYATRLPADYAFLRDPKLSIEEKLSRCSGLLLTKSEQDLLRQMEKMAPGSTANAPGATGAPAAPRPKPPKFSLWGIAKQLLPPLNLASQLIGDAQLVKLATQVSGPVLAAAATAVGLPALAPLAAKLGPSLVSALTKDVSADLSALTGGAPGSGASAATGAGTGGASKASGDGGTSEKAQLMELQRLQDRDKELFSLFSNMLKAMHDARMTAIQNIR